MQRNYMIAANANQLALAVALALLVNTANMTGEDNAERDHVS
jgi:hypothetical protein